MGVGAGGGPRFGQDVDERDSLGPGTGGRNAVAAPSTPSAYVERHGRR